MVYKKWAKIALFLSFLSVSPSHSMSGDLINGTCFCNCTTSSVPGSTEWSTWFSQGYTIFVCTLIGYETVVKPIAVKYVFPGIKNIFTRCKTCCTKSKKDTDKVHKMINDVGLGNPSVRDSLIKFTDILKKYVKDHKDQPKLYNVQELTKEYMGVDVPYGYSFNLGPSVKIHVERTLGKILEKIKSEQLSSQVLVPSFSFSTTDSPHKPKLDDAVVIREDSPEKKDKKKTSSKSSKEAEEQKPESVVIEMDKMKTSSEEKPVLTKTKSLKSSSDEKKSDDVVIDMSAIERSKNPSPKLEREDVFPAKSRSVGHKPSHDIVLDISDSSSSHSKKKPSPSKKKLHLVSDMRPGFSIMYNLKKQEGIVDTVRSILKILSEYQDEMDAFKQHILKIGLKGGIQIGKGWDIVDGEKKEYQLVRMGNYAETEDSEETFINPLISVKFYYDPLKCLEHEAELMEKLDRKKTEGGMTFRGQISRVATDLNEMQALQGIKFSQ